MTKLNSLKFEGADWSHYASEFSDELFADLIDCGKSGDAEEAVEYVMRTYEVDGSPETCAAYLRGYGAWDDEQLADHAQNLRRLVWLAGSSLRENSDAYFCTY